MKKAILIIALLTLSCTSKTLSQKSNIDFTKIAIEKSDTIGRDHYNEFPNGIGSIFNSKSTFEVRLITSGMMSKEYQYLMFKDGNWYGEDINFEGQVLKLKENLDYFRIIDSLLVCNIHTLPSQGDLTLKGDIDDGLEYFLVVKSGDKIRCIEFRNPDYFLKRNPNITELKNYLNIISIIGNLFVSNWEKVTKSLQIAED